jgi:hypothetical protein
MDPNGLEFWFRERPAVAGYEVLLASLRIRSGETKVLCREAGPEETGAHGFGGCGDGAYGVGYVDLDGLLEDFVRELADSGIELLLGVCGREERGDGKDDGDDGGAAACRTSVSFCCQIEGSLCG